MPYSQITRVKTQTPAPSATPVSTIQRRMVPSGPIRVTTTLISSVCPLQPHFGRQTPTMAAVGTPGRLDALLTAEGVTVHARTPSREHRRPRQSRRPRPPDDDKASRAARRRRTAKRK
jgi:hypothetical protein